LKREIEKGGDDKSVDKLKQLEKRWERERRTVALEIHYEDIRNRLISPDGKSSKYHRCRKAYWRLGNEFIHKNTPEVIGSALVAAGIGWGVSNLLRLFDDNMDPEAKRRNQEKINRILGLQPNSSVPKRV